LKWLFSLPEDVPVPDSNRRKKNSESGALLGAMDATVAVTSSDVSEHVYDVIEVSIVTSSDTVAAWAKFVKVGG